MNDDNRSNFFAKTISVGFCSVMGLGFVYYGLKAYGEEQGIAALLLPFVGVSIGVLFLRTAWKMSGE